MDLRKRKEPKYDISSGVFDDHLRIRNAFNWTTSSGNTIPLKEMDINHLRNAIAKINRGDHPQREHLGDTLSRELEYRLAVEREIIKNHTKDEQRRTLQGA
tara:strand:- start:685 stop:987 length:303 start_codon:yes stop_codon:yes gene_type:complete